MRTFVMSFDCTVTLQVETLEEFEKGKEQLTTLFDAYFLGSMQTSEFPSHQWKYPAVKITCFEIEADQERH